MLLPKSSEEEARGLAEECEDSRECGQDWSSSFAKCDVVDDQEKGVLIVA